MTTYSNDELEVMMVDLESDLVERKRSAADRKAIRRNICAFANDLPGHRRSGVLLIGVENDGSCAGLTVTDEVLRNLAQLRDDGNILPLPSMRVEKRILRGCDVAVVMVEPLAAPPVRYQGRAFVKIGPTVRVATPEEEARLAERRRAGDLPLDLRSAVSATLDNLDLEFFRQEYLPRAVAPEVLEQNRRAETEQLAALRFTLGGVPTYGALIVAGRDPLHWVPGAWIQFLRLDGTELTDPIMNQRRLSGRLADVLRQLDEILEINIVARTRIADTPTEVREPDYPLAALQQLARNAVMHRSYEGTNAPVRVYWYSDRVEIQSPGGLFGRVTPENIIQGVTDYRNPLIAEAMHHLGYAQRFGLGLPLARQLLSQNGNPPPEFEFQPNAVLVTLRPLP